MPATATESTFELATIERLQQLGYRYCHGTDIHRPTTEVVLVPELRAYLGRRYRHLPPGALDLAVERITAPEGVNRERRNLAFHRLLHDGFTLRYAEHGLRFLLNRLMKQAEARYADWPLAA